MTSRTYLGDRFTGALQGKRRTAVSFTPEFYQAKPLLLKDKEEKLNQVGNKNSTGLPTCTEVPPPHTNICHL